MSPLARAAILCAALAIAPSAAAGPNPSRIAIVEPREPDPIVREAITRLQAELTAAGFTVVLARAESTNEPHRDVEGAGASAGPFATIAIARTRGGATAELWVADHVTHKTLVRRVDTDATAESHVPTALAIRAVELLRASLLEVTTHAEPARAEPSLPPDVARWTNQASPTVPLPPPRALLERLSLSLGFAALYGMGESTARLAPTLRVSYGAGNGLAGRLTMIGPTATDQLALLELAYGFDRSWRTVVPVLSAGAGAYHSFMEGSGGPDAARLFTRAWAVVLGGSAGVAIRAGDRAAFVFDTHLLFADPLAGAVIARQAAAGRPELVVSVSLGVAAGF